MSNEINKVGVVVKKIEAKTRLSVNSAEGQYEITSLIEARCICEVKAKARLKP